jgi:hypothetical protein
MYQDKFYVVVSPTSDGEYPYHVQGSDSRPVSAIGPSHSTRNKAQAYMHYLCHRLQTSEECYFVVYSQKGSKLVPFTIVRDTTPPPGMVEGPFTTPHAAQRCMRSVVRRWQKAIR